MRILRNGRIGLRIDWNMRQEAVFNLWQILQSIPQKMRTIPKGLKRKHATFMLNKTMAFCKAVYHRNYHAIFVFRMMFRMTVNSNRNKDKEKD